MSFRTDEYPVSLWHQFATQADAAASARRFMIQAANQPYLIGYSHCQYRDHFSPERGNMVKPGFIRTSGQPYEEYLKEIVAATAEMKRIHSERTLRKVDR